MVEHDKFLEDLNNLEKLLVRQFRELQKLTELTRKEREVLLNGGDALMRMVEDKEALLDQLSMMEDTRRQLVQDLAVALQLQSKETSIRELLPHLDPDVAQRIYNLSEGVHTLSVQARELNRANQALAMTRLEWARAAQEFLISQTQPEVSYRPPGNTTGPQTSTAWGVEFRA